MLKIIIANHPFEKRYGTLEKHSQTSESAPMRRLQRHFLAIPAHSLAILDSIRQ